MFLFLKPNKNWLKHSGVWGGVPQLKALGQELKAWGASSNTPVKRPKLLWWGGGYRGDSGDLGPHTNRSEDPELKAMLPPCP